MEIVKETNLRNFELAKLRVLQVLAYAIYYMLSSVTRQDGPILHAHLAFLAWSHKIKDHLFGVLYYKINPSLTKLVLSCVFIDLDFVSLNVKTHSNMEQTFSKRNHQ